MDVPLETVIGIVSGLAFIMIFAWRSFVQAERDAPVSSAITSASASTGLNSADNTTVASFEDTATAVKSGQIQLPSLSQQDMLQLYGLYKQATEGPCTTSTPSVLQLTEHAKWQSWSSMGDMERQTAKANYIQLIDRLSTQVEEEGSQDSAGFSGFGGGGLRGGHDAAPEGYGTGNEDEDMPSVCMHASNGALLKLQDCLRKDGAALNTEDADGRTPLIWAADRGHVAVANYLVDSGAHIDHQDADGETALHMAVMCEHEAVTELLLAARAKTNVPNSDGETAMSYAKALAEDSMVLGMMQKAT